MLFEQDDLDDSDEADTVEDDSDDETDDDEDINYEIFSENGHILNRTSSSTDSANGFFI